MIPCSKKSSGEVGSLPDSKEAFPFIRMIEILQIIFRHVSLSSSPECLERAEESFFNSWMACWSQPPRDSKTRGINLIPWVAHASDAAVILLLYLILKAWPAKVAAPWIVASCRGLITVTSRAASNPAAHPPIYMSAGRLLLPGRRCCPSLIGFSA